MEMYQVRYFLSVARTLNFTRAAEDCGVAQPSLSRAIKQLEAELGGDLFRRERPQAILTELGHRMLPILNRCYESANNAMALATAVKKGETGTLRLALSLTIDLDLVLGHLLEVSRVFERLTLVVLRGNVTETLGFLKTGDAEMAVAAGTNEEPQSLARWPLFEEGFLLICSRRHRLANRTSVRMDDIRSERFVLPRYGEHLNTLAELLTNCNVEVGTAHEAYSDADLAKLAAAGVGVAIVPRSASTPEGLASIPIEGLNLRRTVCLFGASNRARSAPASLLMNLLRASDWEALASARPA
jgi:DNA-binding transcriptional LysR family regulator